MKPPITKPAQSPLAPYACHEADSKGRRYTETHPVYRSQYQRDRDRIIHSAAFRRLEYKTQVFVNHEGDLFRTRLTHSIEVAQIARSVSRTLGLNEDLVEAISLAHDLGHTPFGHAGQEALNACMREFGGFEHNLQSLRVIEWLEEKYAEFNGLNLMFETREGILKHCSKNIAAEIGDLGERFLRKLKPSLEAQLANVCDEIAYNNHDVDDGLRSGLIEIDDLLAIELFEREFQTVRDQYPQLGSRRLIHEIVRRMINRQVTDLTDASMHNIAIASPENADAVRNQAETLIKFSSAMQSAHDQLKRFLHRKLYKHHKVCRMATKAQRIVKEIFGAYMDNHLLLPSDQQQRIDEADPWSFVSGKQSRKARIIADYIAGMTDRYAIAEYERLFNPKFPN